MNPFLLWCESFLLCGLWIIQSCLGHVSKLVECTEQHISSSCNSGCRAQIFTGTEPQLTIKVVQSEANVNPSG